MFYKKARILNQVKFPKKKTAVRVKVKLRPVLLEVVIIWNNVMLVIYGSDWHRPESACFMFRLYVCECVYIYFTFVRLSEGGGYVLY